MYPSYLHSTPVLHTASSQSSLKHCESDFPRQKLPGSESSLASLLLISLYLLILFLLIHVHFMSVFIARHSHCKGWMLLMSFCGLPKRTSKRIKGTTQVLKGWQKASWEKCQPERGTTIQTGRRMRKMGERMSVLTLSS